MAFQLSNEDEERDDHMPESFKKIAELEAQIITDRQRSTVAQEELRKDIKDLKEKIEDLVVLLDTLRTMGKLAKYIEAFFLFVGKASIAVGIIYALYKFGLAELAEKVKSAGGK